MANNRRAAVRKVERPDPRVARTTQALGTALIELLHERPFDSITVQQILDRAGVGRTAFYTHFRNKDDVLESSYERLFASLDGMLARSPAPGRVFPVAEFLTHIGESRDLVAALQRDGQLDQVWSLCTAHAARLIVTRIAPLRASGSSAARRLARMLAGAMVEQLRWWLDHPDSATPGQLDTEFHALVRRVVLA